MKCKLRVILAERGMKSSFLAEKVGVQRSTMSLIVNGKSIPTLLIAMRIAKILGIKVEDIWEEEAY